MNESDLIMRLQHVVDNYARSSFKELERITGIHNATIGNYMRGQRKVALDFIISLLENFPDLNPDWLLLGQGDMKRKIEPIEIGSVIKLQAKDDIIRIQKEEIEFLRSMLKK